MTGARFVVRESVSIHAQEPILTVAETVTGRGTQTAPELIPLLDQAAEAATKLRDRAVAAVSAKVASGGKIDGAALEREQHAAHGLAWIATYVEALAPARELCAGAWTARAGSARWRACSPRSRAGEYLAQLAGGVMMSQSEMVRLHELGVKEADAGGVPHPCGPRADPRRDARGPRPRGRR